MTHVVHITDDFAVARALGAEDFSAIAAQGFRTVLNFLPDGETKSQLSSDEARRRCENAGMAYAHDHLPALRTADDAIHDGQRFV